MVGEQSEICKIQDRGTKNSADVRIRPIGICAITQNTAEIRLVVAVFG